METSEQRGAQGHAAGKTELVESSWDRQKSESQAELRASTVQVQVSGSPAALFDDRSLEFTSKPSLADRRSSDIHHEPCVKEANIIAAMKLEKFSDCTATYDIKTPTGELFAGRANGKVGRLYTFRSVAVCVLSERLMVCECVYLCFNTYMCVCVCVCGLMLLQRVAVSSVKSSVPLSPRQLIELLFSSQAIEHCKVSPPLQHGFLVQVTHCNVLCV